MSYDVKIYLKRFEDFCVIFLSKVFQAKSDGLTFTVLNYKIITLRWAGGPIVGGGGNLPLEQDKRPPLNFQALQKWTFNG